MDFEFLLIGRHGRLSDLGAVCEVARGLAKTLSELKDSDWPITITAVGYADTPESRATAEIYSAAVKPSPSSGFTIALDPHRFPPYGHEAGARQVPSAQESIDERLCAERSRQRSVHDDGAIPAVLLVGHQPAIDWLLDGCLTRGTVLPALASAEIACLARKIRDTRSRARDAEESVTAKPPWRQRSARWHLWWVLTPEKAAAIEPLRTKLTSKMVVLGVLAGFTLAATATILVTLPDGKTQHLLAGMSVICLSLSAGIYICVLLAYDELMMPARFWRARRFNARLAALRGRFVRPLSPVGRGPVARPPSSAGIVIFQQMVALWHWAIGALALSGLGILLLALSEFLSHWPWVCLAGAVLALVVVVWWLIHRPRVGSQD